MRYKIKIAYREVMDPEGERTIHQTSSQFDKPIFMYDNNDEANARGVGLGSQVFGPGHYTSQNPIVTRGYKSFLPLRREEVLPRGTRIFDYDNPTDEELLSIITAYKSKYKHPAKVNQLFQRCIGEKRYKLNVLAQELSEWQPDSFNLGGFSASGISKKIASIDDVRRRLNFVITELGHDAIEYRSFTNHPKAEEFLRISDAERELIIDFVIKNKRSIELQNMDQEHAFWYLNDVLKDPNKVYNLYQSFAKLSNFDHEAMMNVQDKGTMWKEYYKGAILDYISKIAVENYSLERDDEYLLENSVEKRQRKINRALRKHESAKNILVTNRAILTIPDIFEKVRFDPDSLTDEEKARYADETITTKKEYYTELLSKGASIKLTLLEISDLLDVGVDPKLLENQLRFRSDLDVTKMNFFQKYNILKKLYPYFGEKILKMLFTPQEINLHKILFSFYLDRSIEDKSKGILNEFSAINNRFLDWAKKAISNINDIAVKCPNCKTEIFLVQSGNNEIGLSMACYNCGVDLREKSMGADEAKYNNLSLEEYVTLFNEIYNLNKVNNLKNLSLIMHKCFSEFIVILMNALTSDVLSENEYNFIMNNSEFIKNITDSGYGSVIKAIERMAKPKAAFNYKKYKLVLGK